MPSFVIHSAVASKLNEYLNLDDELFMIGNIMPDCWRNTADKDTVKRTRSHFQPIGEDTEDEDYKYFYNKYKDKMNNPIYLGYLTHLLTDIYWRKYVLPEYRYYVDDELFVRLRDGSFVSGLGANKLYNDEIHNLDYEIFNKYGIFGFPDVENVNEIEGFDFKIDELDVNGLPQTFRFANKTIDDAYPQKSIIFRMSALEEHINNTCLAILKELNKLKSKDLENDNNRIR